MKSVAILFFVAVTTQVVRAQSRSASNLVRRGGSPNVNAYLERYVMLLNRASDESFDQEGIYVSMSARLDDPSTWSTPAKIMDGGQWYPQVIGTEDGSGTDKLAGEEARFFMSGRSSWVIRFRRPAP